PGARPLQEIGERIDDVVPEEMSDRDDSVMAFPGGGMLSRPEPQRRDRTGQYKQGRQSICARPAELRSFAGSEEDGARPGEQVAGAIADLVGRRALGQLIVRECLDAVGVNDDVLGCGKESGDRAPQRETANMMNGIAGAELDHSDREQRLDGPKPCAPLPEKA